MFEFVAQYWIEFFLTLIISLIAALCKKYKALNEGMQTMLRCQLYAIYNEALDRGYCPIHKKEQADDIYQSYHALKANGTGTQVHDDIMEMPTKPQKGDD